MSFNTGMVIERETVPAPSSLIDYSNIGNILNASRPTVKAGSNTQMTPPVPPLNIKEPRVYGGTAVVTPTGILRQQGFDVARKSQGDTGVPVIKFTPKNELNPIVLSDLSNISDFYSSGGTASTSDNGLLIPSGNDLGFLNSANDGGGVSVSLSPGNVSIDGGQGGGGGTPGGVNMNMVYIGIGLVVLFMILNKG